MLLELYVKNFHIIERERERGGEGEREDNHFFPL